MNKGAILKLSSGILVAVCLCRLFPYGKAEIRQMKIKRELRELQTEGSWQKDQEPTGCPELAGILEYERLHMREEIVRGTDDQYYLDHLCDGTYSEKGTLFFAAGSGKEDMNRVLFGHHVFLENSRMTPLFSLLEETVEEADLHFVINDGEGVTYYRMLAVLEVDYSQENVFNYLKSEYSDDELAEYNRHLKEDCVSCFFREVKEGDRLLTMMTCRDEEGPVRILFIAAEEKRYPE